jgi:hypothetical protein
MRAEGDRLFLVCASVDGTLSSYQPAWHSCVMANCLYAGGVQDGVSAAVCAGKRLRKLVRVAAGVLDLPFGVVSVYKVATYLTRLETRTKESNMPASEWVTKPRRAMKVKSACRLTHDPVFLGRCSVVSS